MPVKNQKIRFKKNNSGNRDNTKKIDDSNSQKYNNFFGTQFP